MRWASRVLGGIRMLGLATGLASTLLMLAFIVMEGLSPGGSILVSEPNAFVRYVEITMLLIAIGGLFGVIWKYFDPSSSV
jgi:hypothetical protein